MSFELSVITNENRREVWKRAFRMWQKRPHEVAPIESAERVCASCGTKYLGNYCPRCGQAARIGRFSFKNAFLLFLDVWGIGNRGMFRSIRDLMLRPGYMIRDYISGHQSAYFPPFKMFFILMTFSLLISHGIDLGFNSKESNSAKTEEIMEEGENTIKVEGRNEEKAKTVRSFLLFPKYIHNFSKKNPAIFGFLSLLLWSAPLYLFIRRCPAIPDLRFSEHLVAMVYTSNMYTIFTIISSLLPFHLLSDITKLLAVIMIFVALHQLTGDTKRRLLRYILLTVLITLVIVSIIIIGVGFIISLFNK